MIHGIAIVTWQHREFSKHVFFVIVVDAFANGEKRHVQTLVFWISGYVVVIVTWQDKQFVKRFFVCNMFLWLVLLLSLIVVAEVPSV